jgi:hypothetical protein
MSARPTTAKPMRGVVPDVIRRASIVGLRRGLGGSRPWVVIGVVAVGARILMRLAQEDEAVLYRTLIRPGDVFEIATGRDPKAR